jgi:hypothetical protein
VSERAWHAGSFTPRARIALRGRTVAAFQVWGVVGVGAGVALAAAVTWRLDLAWTVVGVQIVVSLGVVPVVVMVGKMCTGRERLVFYHDALAVTIVNVAVLHLLGRPLWPHLLLVALAVGCVLAVGRVGCLASGCCFGRPGARGVRYGAAHVVEGFPAFLVGVPLFPVQLVEAAAALGIVAVASGLVVRGASPAEAFAGCVVGQTVVRFVVEFGRGDHRRRWRGVSEAQATALALSWLVTALELAARLPLVWWHVAAACALLTVTLLRLAAAVRDHSVSSPP